MKKKLNNTTNTEVCINGKYSFTFENNYRNFLVQAFIIAIGIVFYFIFSNETSNKYNMANILIYLISLLICLFSVNNIKTNKFKIYNSWLFIFYSFLLWNTLNVSELQFKKEYSDLYYYFFGPLVFFIFILLGDRMSVDKINIVNKDIVKRRITIIVLIILIVYILLNYYTYTQVGFRLYSDKLIRYTLEDDYVVPRFAGMIYTLMWTMIIFIPHIKKSFAILIIPIIILFSGVLHFKRGNIFRIILFLILCYCYKNRKNIFQRDNILKIIAVILISLFLFTYVGEIRQLDLKNIFDIKDQMKSMYDSNVLNWFYNYTSMSFDVLKLYFDSNPTYIPYNITIPFMSYFGKQEQMLEYYNSMDNLLGISNASTFLSGFIIDFGGLYVLELILYSSLIGALIIIIRKYQFTGLYIFVQMLIIINFFGNYFVVPAIFTAITFSLFIYICCIFDEKRLFNTNNIKNFNCGNR